MSFNCCLKESELRLVRNIPTLSIKIELSRSRVVGFLSHENSQTFVLTVGPPLFEWSIWQ